MGAFAILGLLLALPLMALHTFLLVVWSFWLKHAGRLTFSSLVLFGGVTGALLLGLASLRTLAGYAELTLGGSVLVLNGQLQAAAYSHSLILAAAGAIWGVLSAAILYVIAARISRRASGST
jgi:hypothetical protein